ncbi:MAG TPA: hypothetical protein DEO99_02865, partial [Bacteroidetes bacterium]|nr:hypothetical protein [Bacteroidota bacterium]
ADTALKTADAGYLTRRLVDVAQDVVVTEEDCHTLRGLSVTALIQNDEVVEGLEDRIIGRVALNDVVNPQNDEVILEAGSMIMEHDAKRITEANIDTVDVRSPLTCEARRGVCVKCYGRNLASNRVVEMGDAVGILAAQSIG